MRTVIYPLDREDERANKELLDYLFDTVLFRTGTMKVESPNGNLFEVFTIMEPHSTNFTYCATLVGTPAEYRGAPARYIGVTSKDSREIKGFILGYRTREQAKEKYLKKKEN